MYVVEIRERITGPTTWSLRLPCRRKIVRWIRDLFIGAVERWTGAFGDADPDAPDGHSRSGSTITPDGFLTGHDMLRCRSDAYAEDYYGTIDLTS